MKRALCIVTCLLALCIGTTQAYYVVIFVDVTEPPDPKKAPPQPNGGGGVGGRPVPGGGGFRGNAGGGIQPGGSGGVPTQPGGIGGGPVPPNGNPGTGIRGGQPVPRPPVGDRVRVMTVVEIKSTVDRRAYESYRDKWTPLLIRHHWGITEVPRFAAGIRSELLNEENKPVPSAAMEFKQQVEKLAPEGEEAKITAAERFHLARWALDHGLLNEFRQEMDKLAVMDPKNPSVQAYSTLKKQLEAEPETPNKEIDKWLGMVYGGYGVRTGKHYVLLHGLGNNLDPTSPVARKLDDMLANLEDLYHGYHYFFALRGQVLPVPKQKMVTVLIKGSAQPGRDFARINRIFGNASVHSGSFYAPRHDLLAFAPTRLDEQYQKLNDITRPIFDKLDPDRLMSLSPKEMPKSLPPLQRAIWLQQGRLADKDDRVQVGVVQTYGLVMRSLEEETRLTAATHQGSRQLLFASGLLPANVMLPEWIQSGMGSLFEAPPTSPWRGYGTTHWLQYFTYNDLVKENKLPNKDFATLRDIVTDKYFRESKKGIPSDKATATAWALTFYLAHNHSKELLDYFAELRKLPRDLELSDEVMLDAFARAFNCIDPTTKKRSDARLDALARRWRTGMGDITLEHRAMLENLHKIKKELAAELVKSKKPDKRPGGRIPPRRDPTDPADPTDPGGEIPGDEIPPS